MSQRILVVDDEPDNRELMQLVLGLEGFHVVTASCGEEALASIARDRPDIILLDVMMPGMNGFDVAARIKSDVATQCIPVIIVTALEDSNARSRAASVGADGFLAKPFNRAELIVRIRSFLAK